ncbi:MAG: divalent cation tolerance protein CutA [Terracidiphilus sp.]|jgi:uncharacterized protein involved in tolerance to divalent cations
MPSPTPPARTFLTTTANPDKAARLARALVEEQLAACDTPAQVDRRFLKRICR